jgi:hypothetical protein
LLRACTFRISRRPFWSGTSTVTCSSTRQDKEGCDWFQASTCPEKAGLKHQTKRNHVLELSQSRTIGLASCQHTHPSAAGQLVTVASRSEAPLENPSVLEATVIKPPRYNRVGVLARCQAVQPFCNVAHSVLTLQL